MFSKIKEGFGIIIAAIIVFVALASVSAKAQEKKPNDDTAVPQELPLEAMSFRYNSLDGTVWDLCSVEKSTQTHGFLATCGEIKFKAHVLFRVWLASNGAPKDEMTYDLFVIVDRLESGGRSTSSVQNTEINVASGGKVNKINADVSFDNGNYFFRTAVDLTK